MQCINSESAPSMQKVMHSEVATREHRKLTLGHFEKKTAGDRKWAHPEMHFVKAGV